MTSAKLDSQTRVAEESPGEIGSYTETEIESTTDGRKTPSKVAGTFKRGAVLGQGTSFRRCPDSSGVVRGEYKSRQAESIAVDFPGPNKGSYSTETTVEARLKAHVGDDALAKDYEYRGTIAMEVRGRDARGKRIPTRVWRVSFSQSGLDPRKGTRIPMGPGSDGRAESWGPRGRVTGDEVSLVLTLWGLGDVVLQDRVRAQLLSAEEGWRGETAWPSMRDPTDGRFSSGGSIRVDAVARRSKQDGGVVQPTTLEAGACSSQGETVSPPRGPNPGAFTFSDPGRRWKASGPTPCPGGEERLASRGRQHGGHVQGPRRAHPFLHGQGGLHGRPRLWAQPVGNPRRRNLRRGAEQAGPGR